MGTVRSKIKHLQMKVEETPKREQELLSLNRDYENIREIYNSILNRKLEAEIAVSLEKKQKGEQFRVIDPAKIPELPVEPDVRKIILFTLILGLGLGSGLAYLREMTDTSFKSPDELENDVRLPILTTVPFIFTQNELKGCRRRNLLFAASLAAAFVSCFIGIIVASKGVGSAFEYLKTVVANTL